VRLKWGKRRCGPWRAEPAISKRDPDLHEAWQDTVKAKSLDMEFQHRFIP
jgi:hypothetical protein